MDRLLQSYRSKPLVLLGNFCHFLCDLSFFPKITWTYTRLLLKKIRKIGLIRKSQFECDLFNG